METAAENYRAGLPFDASLLKGMGKTGVPIFAQLTESGAPNVYADDKFVLYLNACSPYPELDERAGMSFVHLLACPRERIYNAVSLRPTDVPLLEHMRDTVNTLMHDREFRMKVLPLVRDKIIPLVRGDGAPFPDLDKRLVAHCIAFAKGEFTMTYNFHKDPHHSVGQLHMHCNQVELWTNTAFDEKNTPLDELVRKEHGEEVLGDDIERVV
jgi:hypothetical protein